MNLIVMLNYYNDTKAYLQQRDWYSNENKDITLQKKCHWRDRIQFR